VAATLVLIVKQHISAALLQGPCDKNLAIANRSRVSCAHNTPRASIGLITLWLWNLG